MNHMSTVLAALLCATLAAPAIAGQPVIERSNLEIQSSWAASSPEETEDPIPHSAPGVEPTGTTWALPYVVDTDDPAGTTTLVAVRVRVVDELEANGFLLRLFDEAGNMFLEDIKDIGHRAIYTFNLRDQPGLAAGGMRRGLVRINPSDGVVVSVDYFIVTPGQDFATGGQAFSTATDLCPNSSSRVLVGGPFTGGTRFLVHSTVAPGTLPADPPALTGSVYDEAGKFVNSFHVKSNDYVFELDAADLIGPASLFGFINFEFKSTGAILSFTGAEGRYSVGTPSVCTAL